VPSVLSLSAAWFVLCIWLDSEYVTCQKLGESHPKDLLNEVSRTHQAIQ
jgi:hypothetical protein